MIQTVIQVDSAIFTPYWAYTYPVRITGMQIWVNSPLTWLKFLTGPKVGLCKPFTSGVMFLRPKYTSWIISQSHQLLGDQINQWCPSFSFTSDADFSEEHFETPIITIPSSDVLEESLINNFFALFSFSSWFTHHTFPSWHCIVRHPLEV